MGNRQSSLSSNQGSSWLTGNGISGQIFHGTDDGDRRGASDPETWEERFWKHLFVKVNERGEVPEQEIVADYQANWRIAHVPPAPSSVDAEVQEAAENATPPDEGEIIEKYKALAEEQFLANTTRQQCCPKNHPLVKKPTYNFTCDKCWKHGFQEVMYCRPCDYGLCFECYNVEEKRTRAFSKMLEANPHFPKPELSFIPKAATLEIDLSVVGATTTLHLGTYLSVQQVTVSSAQSGRVFDRYVGTVPVDQRNVERIHVKFQSSSSLDLVENIEKAFSAGSSAHTLILDVNRTFDPTILENILKAQPPALRCLVLKNLDLKYLSDQRLKSVILDHPILEELSLDSDEGELRNEEALWIAQQQEAMEEQEVVKKGFSIFRKADLTVPPPSVQAARGKLAALESQVVQPVTKEAFAQEEDLATCLGLVLTTDDVVIPLGRDRMHCFMLLPQLLHECDESERLIPLDMQPAVSPETVALAVHFVTHYVTEAVHEECAEKEAALVVTNNKDARYYWNQSFQAFRSRHIIDAFPSDGRRVQVLCELMALAAYLNVPSIKRFVRGALAHEKLNF